MREETESCDSRFVFMRNNYEHLSVFNRSLDVSVQIMKVIDDIRP
jgi:hypothetical protein